MSNGARIWSAALASATRSSPAVISGRVYFGTDAGKLLALRASDGGQQWSYTLSCGLLENCKITSSPAVARTGEIIFGALNGTVYALRDDGNSASLRWSYSAGDGVSASPALALNQVVYLSGPAGAYALDVQTGAVRWKKTGFACADSSPAVDSSGALWTAADDGFVRVFRDL
jgi:outer membrane protein assembly factor BamB